jgi:hypothetical protein
MASKSNTKSHVWIFLAGWFVINILQALLTELAHDEAYYWVYAQNLDWGYFDHPPGVAASIAVGYALIKSELGVRLVITMMSVATIYLVWKIIIPKKEKLLFIILGSIVLVHIGGFIAVPDIPLMFFSFLFVFLFKKYLTVNSMGLAVLLGVAAAGMLYSKYHAILLIFFCLLPNLSLLRLRSFWVFALIGSILFLPHLLWQWDHDLVTFRFHLFERSMKPYSWNYPLDYLAGQVIVYGPLISPLLFYSAWKYRSKSQFDRTMKFLLYGIFTFFLLNSFRGRIEANWTISALPALLFLSYEYISRRKNIETWTIRLGIPSIIVILIIRFYFVIDFLPAGFVQRNEVHGWDQWVQEIDDLVQDKVPVFRNTYQLASKYSFYSGKPSYSLNDATYKGNQYDHLFLEEERIQGKEVILITRGQDPWITSAPDTVHTLTGGDQLYFYSIDNFHSFNRLRIKVLDPPRVWKSGEKMRMTIEIYNPTTEVIYLRVHPTPKLMIWHRLEGTKGQKVDIESISNDIQPGQIVEKEISFIAPTKAGNYAYRIGIEWNLLGGKNSFLHNSYVE